MSLSVLHDLARWAAENTLAAALPALLLILLYRTSGRGLHPRWLCLAAWVVLLRLWMPAPVTSAPWAWDGWWRQTEAVAEVPQDAPPVPAAPVREVSKDDLSRELAELQAVLAATESTVSAAPLPYTTPVSKSVTPPAPSAFDWRRAAALAWLTGSGVFLLWILLRHGRLVRRLHRESRPAMLPWPELASECARLAGLRRTPPVLSVAGCGSPFLCGLLRPRIFLPAETLPPLTKEEARHILLHEMLHVARKDLAANWLLVLTRAVHWFNPLVHVTARRLLADRELLRDRQAVRLLAPAMEDSTYAQTLLKLAITPAAPVLSPGLAPLFRSEKELKRRLLMLTHSARSRRLPAVLTAAALSAAAALSFTTVQGQETAAAPPAKTAPAPEAPVTATDATPPPAKEAPPATPAQLTPPVPKVKSANALRAAEEEVIKVREDVASVVQKNSAPAHQDDLARVRAELTILSRLEDDARLSATASLSERPAFQQLHAEYLIRKVAVQDQDKSGFGPNHPKTLGMQTQLATMRSQLRALTQDHIEGLKTRLAVLAENKDKITDIEPAQKRSTVALLEAVESLRVADAKSQAAAAELQSLHARLKAQGREKEAAVTAATIEKLAQIKSSTQAALEDRKPVAKADGDERDQETWNDLLSGKSLPKDEEILRLREDMEKLRQELKAVRGKDAGKVADPTAVEPKKPAAPRAEVLPPDKENDLPFGIRAVNQPGFVYGPYHPEGGLIDVTGLPRLTTVKCPFTGKPFRIP